ncbi:MAG: hypothetical protein PVSMB7_17360 [Chloroflexota bacterium]
MIRILSLLALGAAVQLLAPASAPGNRHTAAPYEASTSHLSGVVAAIHQGRMQTVITVRTLHGSLVTMTPGSASYSIAADGRALDVRAIRVGDHLSQDSLGTVQDVSLSVVTLRGIVSVAPLQATDPITFQSQNAWAIIADAGPHTRYSDASRQTSTWDQLQDSDVIELQGLYDSAIGEMTKVQHVTRLGPFRRANNSSGTSHA